MIFHQKTVSERGKPVEKTGNEYLRVFLTVEHDSKEREPLGDIFLTREKGDFLLTYCAEDGEVVEIDRLKVKR